MNQHIDEAFHEAIRRYPESIDALVWFTTAAGLRGCEATEEQLEWARKTLEK